MPLQRYLDDLEVRMISRNGPGTQAVEYQGCVDSHALAKAFELACTRYPVLCARILVDERGYLLYVPPDHHPRLEVFEGDERILNNELQKAWDSSRAVARLLLIRDQRRGIVAFQSDHAIVDGRSFIAIFEDLWRIYTDIVSGNDVTVITGTSLPASPRLVLESESLVSKTESPSRKMNSSDIPDPCEVIWKRIKLTEHDTRKLLAAGRTRKTSIHALVCGSILIAQRQLDIRQTDVTPMVCYTTVDLRDRISSTVLATETTNLLGMHKAEVNLDAHADPVVVARDVKGQFEEALTRGGLPLLDLRQQISSKVNTSLEQRVASLTISNVGIVPRVPHPSELTVSDWFIPFRQQTRLTIPGYMVYTYDSRLNVVCIYRSSLFSSQEVAQLVNGIESHLLGIDN